MAVTVTSLDQYKSTISFAGGDNDAAVLGGVNTALLGKNWTVFDAAANTSGFQAAAFNSTLAGAALTGLANDGTLYDATITIDGTDYPVSYAGSTMQSFTTLVNQLNAAIGANGLATLVGNTILVTSASTGLTSTVSMADAGVFGVSLSLFVSVSGFARFYDAVAGTVGKTYTALIDDGAESGYQEVNVGGNKVAGSGSSLLNDAGAIYLATVTVDGIAYPVSIAGNAAQLYSSFLTELDADLPSPLSSLINGNVRVTSPSTGSGSTIAIVDTPATFGLQFVNVGANKVALSATNLALDTAGFDTVTFGAPVVGTDATSLVAGTTYTADVTIDGTTYHISALGSALADFNAVLGAINTAIGINGTATFVGSTIKVTSATRGTGSSVVITDIAPNHLFDSITGPPAWVSTDASTAGTTTDYTATITINGVGYPVTANGETNQSYGALISTLQTAVGLVNGTVSLVGGNIRVLAAGTPGVGSTVAITAGTLFAPPLNGFVAVLAAVRGTSPAFGSLAGFVAINAGVPGVGAATAGGYEDIFVGGNKLSGDSTGLSDDTFGSQDVVFTYEKVLTDVTGLKNDGTLYTATITVDGAGYPVSAAGSTMQTFTNLLSVLNGVLGVNALASLAGGLLLNTGHVRVRSTGTPGASSTVSIVDTGAHPLFASIYNFYLIAKAIAGTAPAYTFDVLMNGGVIQGHQDANVGGNKLTTDVTSLVALTTYTATVTVDGVGHPISILGSTAQTYGALVSALQTQLQGFANVGLFGGNIRIESLTTAGTSTVAITAGTLFAAPLNGFVALIAAVPGTVQHISINGSAAQTFGALITAVNGAMTGGTIGLNNGNLRITSASTGASSSVVIRNGNTLFPALTDFNGYGPSVPGGAVVSTTDYYVVSNGASGKFGYQQYATWNAILHTGTVPGTRFGFSRTPALGGSIYMYSGVKAGEALAFS